MQPSFQTISLNDGWRIYRRESGTLDAPCQTFFSAKPLLHCNVPGSLFAALTRFQLETADAEQYDWWYCTEFSSDTLPDRHAISLYCESLATLADIWLNGQLIARSHNMFVPVQVDIDNHLKPRNQLAICFRSVHNFLQQRRPRPRWKTSLVNHQQLRWLRTSLMGRIPAWTTATPALGPVGCVGLQAWKAWRMLEAQVTTRLSGSDGHISVRIETTSNVDNAWLEFGTLRIPLDSESQHQTTTFSGSACIEHPALWWPHTHGSPELYPVRVIVSVAGKQYDVDLGKRGFSARRLDLDSHPATMNINGVSIFCRGACWTITDLQNIYSDREDLYRSLQLAKSAGLNMIRISGIARYEQTEFYELCDELGIMVWQDFMFANMDYPLDDPAFLDSVRTEIRTQLTRLRQHPCITVYCGNSEVQQQAAMQGLDQQYWSHAFFDAELPALCESFHPGIPYIASTPSGGALPFHLATGTAHFYGVGNYRRTLASSGADKVRFASESLGFSNVPEPSRIEQLFGGHTPTCHGPTWKQGVPRDAGAGHDFEDVRDHYLQLMFKVDPVQLRSRDTQRYLALSRVVSGEQMLRTLTLWRAPGTPCCGGLVWFYRDLVPGAGWGLLDSEGTPKAAYHYVKRACQDLACFWVDQGLDGLVATVINDTAKARTLRLEIRLINCPDISSGICSSTLEIKSHSHWQSNAETLLGGFRDINYSYQFGPQPHQIASLLMFDNDTGQLISSDHFFPGSHDLPTEHSANISQQLHYQDNRWHLQLSSDRFLQAVTLDLDGWTAECQYFHMVAGVTYHIPISSAADTRSIKGFIEALNLRTPVRINLTCGPDDDRQTAAVAS